MATPQKIETLFAFLATDSHGGEGLFGEFFGREWLPFVGADMANVNTLRPRAEEIAKRTGAKITIAHFMARRDVDTILPPG